MTAFLKRLVAKVSREPVTAISSVLLSIVGWVGPIVVDDFDVDAFNAQFGAVATALGIVIGLIARQFVTPSSADKVKNNPM